MADISQIMIDGIYYNIKDAIAREMLTTLQSSVLQETLTATSTSEFTNDNCGKIYVIPNGNEAGWYYWNQNEWVQGGALSNYVDETLEVNGAAAEVGAVNSKFAEFEKKMQEHTRAYVLPVTPIVTSGDGQNWIKKVLNPRTGEPPASGGRTWGASFLEYIPVNLIQKISIAPGYSFTLGCYSGDGDVNEWRGFLFKENGQFYINDNPKLDNYTYLGLEGSGTPPDNWNLGTSILDGVWETAPSLIFDKDLLEFFNNPVFRSQIDDPAAEVPADPRITKVRIVVRRFGVSTGDYFTDAVFTDLVNSLKIYLSTDTSLTLPGIAADGAVTGLKYQEIQQQVDELAQTLRAEAPFPFYIWRQGGLSNGVTAAAGIYIDTNLSQAISTSFLPFTSLVAVKPVEGYRIRICIYDKTLPNGSNYLGNWNIQTNSIERTNTTPPYSTEPINLGTILKTLPEDETHYKLKVALRSISTDAEAAQVNPIDHADKCVFVFNNFSTDIQTLLNKNVEASVEGEPLEETISEKQIYTQQTYTHTTNTAWISGVTLLTTGNGTYKTTYDPGRYINLKNKISIPMVDDQRELVAIRANEDGYNIGIFIYTLDGNYLGAWWSTNETVDIRESTTAGWTNIFSTQSIYIPEVIRGAQAAWLSQNPGSTPPTSFLCKISIKNMNFDIASPETFKFVNDMYDKCDFFYYNAEQNSQPTSLQVLTDEVNRIKKTIPLSKRLETISWISSEKPLNPYADITFVTESNETEQISISDSLKVDAKHINSIAHLHMNSTTNFRNAYANNVRNFVGLRYHPSEPPKRTVNYTLNAEEVLTQLDILNGENVSFVDAKSEFSTNVANVNKIYIILSGSDRGWYTGTINNETVVWTKQGDLTIPVHQDYSFTTNGTVFSYANFRDRDKIVISPNAEQVYNSILNENNQFTKDNAVHILGPGSLYARGNTFPGITSQGYRYPQKEYTEVIRNMLDHLQYREAGGVIITHPQWTTENISRTSYPHFDVEKFVENCLDFDPLVLGTDVIEGGRLGNIRIIFKQGQCADTGQTYQYIFEHLIFSKNSADVPVVSVDLPSKPNILYRCFMRNQDNELIDQSAIAQVDSTEWYYCTKDTSVTPNVWRWHEGGSITELIDDIVYQDRYETNQMLIDHILQKGKRCWMYSQGDWTTRRGCNELIIPDKINCHDMGKNTSYRQEPTKEQESYWCLKAYREGQFFAKYIGADNNTGTGNGQSGDPNCGVPADLKITNVLFDSTSPQSFGIEAENASGIIIVLLEPDTMDENDTVISGIHYEDSQYSTNAQLVVTRATPTLKVVRNAIPASTVAVRAIAYQDVNYNNDQDTNWPYQTIKSFITNMTPFSGSTYNAATRAAIIEYLWNEMNNPSSTNEIVAAIKTNMPSSIIEDNAKKDYLINYRFEPYRNVMFTNPIMLKPLTERQFNNYLFGSDVM